MEVGSREEHSPLRSWLLDRGEGQRYYRTDASGRDRDGGGQDLRVNFFVDF